MMTSKRIFLATLLIFNILGVLFFPETGYSQSKTDSATKNDLLTIHFINVGKGDAIHISLPDGKTALIDTGYAKTADHLINKLHDYDVTKFDLVVLTHADKDHIGGYPEILEAFPVKRTLQTFDRRDPSRVRLLKIGEVVLSGPGYELKAIAPREKLFDNENDNSIVLRLTYKSVSFLFTGDILEPSQKSLMDSRVPIKSNVLKLPHHGRYPGFNPEKFFRAVAPSYAVITCDEEAGDPPDKDVLEFFKKAGTQVFRTDLDRNIRMESDGRKIIVRP